MDLGEALAAYREAFNEGPAIFDLGIADEKLLELIKVALERGSSLTDKELAGGAGVEVAPPDVIL